MTYLTGIEQKKEKQFQRIIYQTKISTKAMISEHN